MEIESQFDSLCKRCCLPIEQGDMIYLDENEGTWICEECALEEGLA